MSLADHQAARPKGPAWAIVGLGAVLFVMLVGLGTWQMQRLAWKEALIAAVDQRIGSASRPLSELERQFAETGDVDYWPVEATGRLLNDRESHFLATWRGQSGFFVYAPLELLDGRVLFVNRGFVPFDRKDPSTRTEGQIADLVTVKGLARNPLAEKPSSLVPDNDPAKNVFYWKDLAAMAGRASVPADRIVPFFIDADATPNPGGLPIGGVTLVDFPNNHLQYALTWYGLAAALLAVLGAWLISRRRA
ncbi:SURF1 family protein [Mesorhizobium sp. L-8-3]|uniref:SURF1 family protein n=1 Tax=Mesorhizobium sp. L-8-3 TaxID=2744522 RepID=UPI0019252259|nr:SURF1 family protein [Mesorhizobium sp. L-8-3]BCH26160.1 SURF1-like protein [Mesorhizobium sp. L-8-3]